MGKKAGSWSDTAKHALIAVGLKKDEPSRTCFWQRRSRRWWILLLTIFFLVIAGLGIFAYFEIRRLMPREMSKFSVEVRNDCGVTLLVGADGPAPVTPRAGSSSWAVATGQSLWLDVPKDWTRTQTVKNEIGPRIWARTGCAYDVKSGKAQCQTGDCGGLYDCSESSLAGKAPASLAEFCFDCDNGHTFWDISLVDGANVPMNIKPTGTYSSTHPGDPGDVFWCPSSLCKSNSDLRSICPPSYQLSSENVPGYVPGVTPSSVVACFSNCGLAAYPTAPAADCDISNPTCLQWREYCCQARSNNKKCGGAHDAPCDDGSVCWNGSCQCTPWYISPPCAADVCTNANAQPAGQKCSSCIGDDTVHQVCPRAYAWPNDPQTYLCDAISYRITLCPGGVPVPVEGARDIPTCASLPAVFDTASQLARCPATTRGVFMCARQKTAPSPLWDCDADHSGCMDVLCRA